MIKLGITGGIGSGKSIVAELLTLMGIPVYIADTESKRLTDTSSRIKEALISLFGENIYNDSGVDKKKLASLIFNDHDLLRKVNSIIHPEVNRHFNEWMQRQDSSICAVESAILFESGFDAFVDKSVTVFAPESIRIARVMARDKMPIEAIRQRIKNQLSDEAKRDRSDFVIFNDDTTAIIPQVHALLKSIDE